MKQGPLILVANHASYIDAIVLTAALELPLHFTAKAELGRNPLLAWFLGRLGTEFIERTDVRRSVEDAERLIRRIEQGDGILFFPEGTFTESSGLRPFRLGAFKVAAATGTPVVPVALRGTRAVLRGSTWFPRHGRIEVHILAPVEPAGNDWEAVIDLRERARAAILAHCGEPDLSEQVSIALPGDIGPAA